MNTTLDAHDYMRMESAQRRAFDEWLDRELPGWREEKIYRLDFGEGHVRVYAFDLPLRLNAARTEAVRREPEARPVRTVPPRCVLTASFDDQSDA